LQKPQTGGLAVQITGIYAKAQGKSLHHLQILLMTVATPRISISNGLKGRIFLSRQHY